MISAARCSQRKNVKGVSSRVSLLRRLFASITLRGTPDRKAEGLKVKEEISSNRRGDNSNVNYNLFKAHVTVSECLTEENFCQPEKRKTQPVLLTRTTEANESPRAKKDLLSHG